MRVRFLPGGPIKEINMDEYEHDYFTFGYNAYHLGVAFDVHNNWDWKQGWLAAESNCEDRYYVEDY